MLKSELPWKESAPLQSVRDWLNETVIVTAKASGGKATYTGAELIRTVAEQSGAAHEDWNHDEDFLAAQGGGFMVAGMPPHAYILFRMARTVLSVSNTFIDELVSRGLVKRQSQSNFLGSSASPGGSNSGGKGRTP